MLFPEPFQRKWGNKKVKELPNEWFEFAPDKGDILLRYTIKLEIIIN